MFKEPMSRRDFARTAALTSTALFLPGRVLGKDGPAPSERVGVAFIGIGGRGKGHVRGLHGHDRVAFCDVDEKRSEEIRKQFPDVPVYKDYRVMLDKHDKDIDAVVIATPDHSHYRIAMEVISRGKHVYLEKPMAQTLEQVAKITAAANAHGVVTQMGNQGQSTAATRLVREWVQAGVIGPVQEVRAWTDRPIWPQGMTELPPAAPVPETLDWDLWRGDTCDYDYSPAYLPFDWRGWYAFGCGALGDMGCHILNPAFYALDLSGPLTVKAETSGPSSVAFPASSIVSYKATVPGSDTPLPMTWYDGKNQAPRPQELEKGRRMGGQFGGSLIIGTKAIIMTDHHADYARIIPESKMKELRPTLPPKTIPRIKGGHMADWLRGCRGEGTPCSNFNYAAALTNLVLMGALAQRLPGQELAYDPKAGIVGNDLARKIMDHPAG